MAPRRKRDADEVEDEEDELKPTEDDLEAPSSKKTKAATGKKEVEGVGEVHENDAGEKYIKVLYCPRALSHRNSQQLSEYRRLTVRKWKDMVLVDIREFYKDKKDGQVKPGSKGISLTLEQWSALKQGTDVVDDLLEQLK